MTAKSNLIAGYAEFDERQWFAAIDADSDYLDGILCRMRVVNEAGFIIAYCFDERHLQLLAAAPSLLSDHKRMSAEIEKLREAHKENARLLRLVAHDLQGRVDNGKLAAIVQCADRAALASSSADGSPVEGAK